MYDFCLAENCSLGAIVYLLQSRDHRLRLSSNVFLGETQVSKYCIIPAFVDSDSI